MRKSLVGTIENVVFASQLIFLVVNLAFGFPIPKSHHKSEDAVNRNIEDRPQVRRNDQVRHNSGDSLKVSKVDASSTQKIKTNRLMIEKYLKDYGYAPEYLDHLDKRTFTDAIRRFEIFNRLKMENDVFNIFAKKLIVKFLKKRIKNQRCGNRDIRPGYFSKTPNPTQRSRIKRYTSRIPWGKSNLTYKVVQYGKDLPQTVQRQEFNKAFKMWTDAAPGLNIREVQGSEKPDITIEFVRGIHPGCTKPFDGPGFVVAHALLPEDGRIHFDEDEQFTTGGEKNTVNLLSIAVHEIGHALGLDHSSDSTAIMYSLFQPQGTITALSQDDINGIQYLYPKRTPGQCVDKLWCDDLSSKSACSFFKDECKVKCGVCST